MTNGRRSLLAIAIAAVFVLAIAFAATSASGPAAQAAPMQQGKVCTWQNIGQSRNNLFHVASAYDTDKNVMYLYGGVNAQLAPQSTVEKADLSSTDLKATHSRVLASGALSLVGSAGAYRAKGADSEDSAAYFIGGLADPENGNARTDTQRYVVKKKAWERLTTTGLKARVFAAAAYDPVHDVIWVTGGIAKCPLPDVLQGKTCNAKTLPTQYLSWDASGNAQWNTLTGGDMAVYGHTMVYDAANKRMLLYGGTKNISRGENKLVALDLSDADPAKAKLTSVNTVTPGPSVYFHGASMDTANNQMVVYGGVTSNFMQSNESAGTKSYALDLAVNPPAWKDMRAVGNPGVRVAGAMAYAPNHSATIVTLGRDTFLVGDPLPEQRVQRTTWALTCAEAPTEVPTQVPPTAGPTNTPGGQPTVAPPPTRIPGNSCDIANSKVPAQAINDALANPGNYYGYDLPCNPNLPESPQNPLRRMLSLVNAAAPYHPMYNGLIWKCGCP